MGDPHHVVHIAPVCLRARALDAVGRELKEEGVEEMVVSFFISFVAILVVSSVGVCVVVQRTVLSGGQQQLPRRCHEVSSILTKLSGARRQAQRRGRGRYHCQGY